MLFRGVIRSATVLGGFSALLLVAGVFPVSAQTAGPKIYDLTKPAPQTKPANFQSATAPPKQKTPATRISSAERRRLAEQAMRLNRQAAEIERLTGQAFQRSFMNMDDYSDALDVALQLRLAATEKSPQADAFKRQAYRTRAHRLQAAAEQTARLQQPGAAGWASETALGQMKATSAAADLAKAGGDKPSWANLAANSQRAAQGLLQLRQQDYQLGLANDRQIAAAAKAANKPMGNESAQRDQVRLQQLQQTLQTHVQRMQAMQQRPAGNTRPDERHAVRARLQANAAEMELTAGRSIHARAAYLNAEKEYSHEFGQLLQLQQTGTAGLSDLVRNWRQRTAIQASLVKAGFEVPAANRRSRLGDLKQMMQLAGQTRDRRGRIGGDIAIVHGLSLLEQARPLPHKPPAAQQTEKPAATVNPRVIDLKSQLKTRTENIRTGVTIPRNSE